MRLLKRSTAFGDPDTELHLLGVTRTDKLATFQRYGVTSFDSTSPFRQAFKDDRDNYHTDDRTWIALRVPQVDANPKLQRRIRAGEIDGQVARRLEQSALGALRGYDRGTASLEDAVSALREYEALHDEHRDRSARYREMLALRHGSRVTVVCVWRVGIEVGIFRGTERNKRRGFHNLHIFARRLKYQIEATEDAAAVAIT